MFSVSLSIRRYKRYSA